jgi:acyl phosphate:glycerol-3-phosphate acyltransferase
MEEEANGRAFSLDRGRRSQPSRSPLSHLLSPMPYLLAFLAGYGLGMVPFAWLLVRWRHGADLFAVGSANVGANNAFRTTGSRGLGLAVLVLDALKGALAVLAGWVLVRGFGGTASFAEAQALFWPGAVALLGALAGHIYNAFLSLRAGRLAGGKGFATAAGGALLVGPWLVLAWAALFLVGVGLFAVWRGVRDVIPGNVLATALLPLVAWPLYGGRGALLVALFALLTLPRHATQLRALLRGEPTEPAGAAKIGERGPAA